MDGLAEGAGDARCMGLRADADGDGDNGDRCAWLNVAEVGVKGARGMDASGGDASAGRIRDFTERTEPVCGDADTSGGAGTGNTGEWGWSTFSATFESRIVRPPGPIWE